MPFLLSSAHGPVLPYEAQNRVCFVVHICCCNALTGRYSFKKGRVIAPLHTAGPVALTPDGARLVTCVGEDALLTDVKAGVEICRFLGVSDAFSFPVCKH